MARASSCRRRSRSLRKQSSRSFLSMRFVPVYCRLASAPGRGTLARTLTKKARANHARELAALAWACPASIDEPGVGHLIERPDRPLHATIGNPAIVARERRIAIDIKHLFGDRPEGRHEMVGRLQNQNSLVPRIDADVTEQLEAQGLRAVADEDDVDATDPHGGAVAEGYLGGPEALPGISGKPRYRHLGIERLAGGRSGFATQAQRKGGAHASVKRELDRH